MCIIPVLENRGGRERTQLEVYVPGTSDRGLRGSCDDIKTRTVGEETGIRVIDGDDEKFVGPEIGEVDQVGRCFIQDQNVSFVLPLLRNWTTTSYGSLLWVIFTFTYLGREGQWTLSK